MHTFVQCQLGLTLKVTLTTLKLTLTQKYAICKMPVDKLVIHVDILNFLPYIIHTHARFLFNTIMPLDWLSHRRTLVEYFLPTVLVCWRYYVTLCFCFFVSRQFYIFLEQNSIVCHSHFTCFQFFVMFKCCRF